MLINYLMVCIKSYGYKFKFDEPNVMFYAYKNNLCCLHMDYSLLTSLGGGGGWVC